MAADFELATGILAGRKKSLATFERRYGDSVETAFSHCRDAREIGLAEERYLDAVARTAAGTFLMSWPMTERDERLDDHVDRVLGHRDFALKLLLDDGNPAAWSRFADHQRLFIEGLFIRGGRDVEEAAELMKELLAELAAPGPSGRPPISEYSGLTDVSLWLFVYVRRRFRGGITVGHLDSGVLPPEPQPADDDTASVESALASFCEQYVSGLSAPDRYVLSAIALGSSMTRLLASPDLPPRSRTPKAVLDRHERLVQQFHAAAGDAMKRLAASSGKERFLDWQRIILRDLQRLLARICAIEVDP